MTTSFIGEHLLPGIFGHAFIIIAFAASLVATFIYIIASKKQNNSWKIFGNSLFTIQTIFTIAAGIILYYVIKKHYYEYNYVFSYSSNSLTPKFLLSSCWAGQEGSFLLWAIFQSVLGIALMFSPKHLRMAIMAVFSLSQVFILLMILGIPLGDFILGNDPFILMRNVVANMNEPLFKESSYLSFINDGNSLNPLLINDWMVWHPPVLFLGYAACLVPFAFAVAGLWHRDFTSWIKTVIPWTVFALLTLGIGLLLGGAWAYEDLTFGGFWAWDPVENASLVPWLVMIGALHFMLIAKKREQSYGLSFLFAILAYFFVIYSSYLTRSGVLENASAHSFGPSTLSIPLITYLLLFLTFPLILYFYNIKHFPGTLSDNIWSKETWMMLGSLVVGLSAFQIIFTTSIPVFNKIFQSNFSPPINPAAFYNFYQLIFGVLITFIIGLSQYFSYGESGKMKQLKSTLISLVIALIASVLYAIFSIRYDWPELVFCFTIVFCIVASFNTLIKYAKLSGNIGAIVSHAGFGIMLLGVLFAFANSLIISRNTTAYDLGKSIKNKENQLLKPGKKMPLGYYDVIYKNIIVKDNEYTYNIDFFNRGSDGKGTPEFSLSPSIIRSERTGDAAVPATKHFFNQDVFTYVVYSELMADVREQEYDTIAIKDMKEKDTLKIDKCSFILDTIIFNNRTASSADNISLKAKITIIDSLGKKYSSGPTFVAQEDQNFAGDDYSVSTKHKFTVLKYNFDTKKIELSISKKAPDYLIIKTTVFPYIFVLWIGSLIMIIGFVIAIWRRMRWRNRNLTT